MKYRPSSERSRAHLLAACVLASLAAMLAFRILWVGPQRDLLALQRAELEQTSGQAARARREAGRLPGLEAEVERLRRRWDGFRPALPAPHDASALLRGLHEMAVRSGLTMKAFALGAAHPGERFEEWPVRLELTGGFHDLTAFLHDVSRQPRIVTVSRMSIRALSPGAPTTTIAVTCTATTYVLRRSGLEEGAVE